MTSIAPNSSSTRRSEYFEYEQYEQSAGEKRRGLQRSRADGARRRAHGGRDEQELDRFLGNLISKAGRASAR